MTRTFLPGLFIALGVLALGLVVAFTVGRYPVTLAELADVLLSRVTGRPSAASATVENVVLLVRGPRVLAAVMVGAALAVAGTAFQGLFRNPLVSPDILGASSGAALGAVLGIYFSLGVIGIESLAFVGGLVAVAAVYVIGSMLQGRDPILVLVLTGVVIGALLGFEDEDFGGEVGVDVVGAHERQHGAAGEVFDGGDAIGAHGVLVGATRFEHVFGAVAVGEVALAGRQGVLEDDDDEIAVDRGAGFGWAAAGGVGH